MEDHAQLILENLPVGLRFQPTDEELLTHYLRPKLLNQRINGVHIMVLELSKYDPWDLLAQFKKNSRDNVVYFFCHCEYNQKNGNRIRTAGGGHWKCTGKPRPVRGVDGDDEIGTKRSLVFRNPDETQYVITEYAYTAPLSSNITEDFVLCKLNKKSHKNTKNIKTAQNTKNIKTAQNTKNIKTAQHYKLEKRPNKKARKAEPGDGNTDSGSTLMCINQILKEMTTNSAYTQSEESIRMTSYLDSQQPNKTTHEATNPEFTQNVCKRIDISPSYDDESNYSFAAKMNIALPCDDAKKEYIVSQDFGSQDPANRTDISASNEKPFDFDNQNQNDETAISMHTNYWNSVLNSIGDATLEGVQTSITDMPVLEDNQVAMITSSDVGDTMSPKMDVQKWLEEFLEI